MTQQHTQPTDTTRQPRPERTARKVWALTEAELAEVVGGGTEDPGDLIDPDGKATPILF